MKKHIVKLFILSILFLFSCSPVTLFTADNPDIRYSGRVDSENKNEVTLIGSASFAEATFKGNSCEILLRKTTNSGKYNFVSVELDGKFLQRYRIDTERYTNITVKPGNKARQHTLRVYKATEPQNGDVAFGGIRCRKLSKNLPVPERKIEFIGNSITCGMGVDWKDIPCNTGEWYDQHNAWFAYGPVVARSLKADFMLSSVSGIGIYRNWNSPQPVMPEVYENLHLNTDGSKKYDFNRFTPDLVSICLGTNDFSEGDGKSYRAPFDSARYVSQYIQFIITIYSKYPQAQLCLLTSPMVNGAKATLFEHCLSAVKEQVNKIFPDKKPIALYFFEGLTPHGCGSHPDRDDQQKMATLLIPFYKNVMDW